MAYLVHLLTIANIYIVLAVSLDLLVGYTGLISLAHAAFFAIGAYSTAILQKSDIGPFVAMATGMAVAALLSVLAALPSLRVQGVYLLIVTIALQIVTTVVLLNWGELTGGPGGIARIPRSVFGHPLHGLAFHLHLLVSLPRPSSRSAGGSCARRSVRCSRPCETTS